MNEETAPEGGGGAGAGSLRRARMASGRGGCLLRVLIAIAVPVAVVVAIGTIFNQGDNADQPVHGYEAGPAGAYAPGSVTYFEQQHFYIVHLHDGGFVALYDRASKQQELGGDCRVSYDETAGVGTLDPLPGTIGAFVEECNSSRSVWRVDGMFAFGSGYGDLDRFGARVNPSGDLIIDTDSRTCTRSRGVIGVEPFDVKRCGKPDS